MITRDGYKKNSPEEIQSIVVTWSQGLVKDKGGLLKFIRTFESYMMYEHSMWLQKSMKGPRIDVLYVYIIVCNRLYYRLKYGGHHTGQTTIYEGMSWSHRRQVTWPRLLLVGPVVKAPCKIHLRGFQGFRYADKLF